MRRARSGPSAQIEARSFERFQLLARAAGERGDEELESVLADAELIAALVFVLVGTVLVVGLRSLRF